MHEFFSFHIFCVGESHFKMLQRVVETQSETFQDYIGENIKIKNNSN